MQSLELSCQEADFKLNDALSKIKGHHSTSAAETTTSTPRSTSTTHHHNRHHSFNNQQTQSNQNSQNVANSAMAANSSGSTATITTLSLASQSTCTEQDSPAYQNNNNNNSNTNNNNTNNNNNSTARSPISKRLHGNDIGAHQQQSHQQVSTSIASTSHDGSGSANDTINTSNTNTPMPACAPESMFFDIHEKLRELYVYLYLKDIQDTQVDNRIKLKSRSFVLETLVARENLNTVILNLYPGNKGYSLAFRQEYLPQNKNYDGLNSIFSRSSLKNQLCGATDASSMNCNRQEKEEHLLETVRWPYEIGDLLESINNEELPILYMKLLLSYAPNAFYSGCVIVEVRDYRQSFPLSACCDNYYVLLKPTTQTLLADVKVLSNDEDFTHEDRVSLESNMVLATAAPLCLDPNPKVARKAFYSQYKRQMWNTFAIRRQMRKFSQVAINRKRKTDQFTHTSGMELSDYLFRARQRPRQMGSQSFDSSIRPSWKIPRKASDVIKPIRTPNLDLPTTLKPPSNVNVAEFAKAYERPRETKDCMPQLIEEYILETDRGGGRVYHIKLSIYQRPANSEYLGELYVDRDYQQDSRNGEACQFSLGTRAHANRYIQQFTEIFTEEGRKSVKITHIVPGQAPKVSYTTGMVENRQPPPPPTQGQQPTQKGQQYEAGQSQARTSVQTQSAQSLPQTTQQPMITDDIPSNSVATSSITLNATNPQALSNTANPTIIGIANMHTASTSQKIYNSCDGTSTPTVATAILSPRSTHVVHANSINPDIQVSPQHLSIANGSLVVVQDQASGVATIASQSPQQNNAANQPQGLSTTANLPLLQAQLQVAQQAQTSQLTNKTAHGNSNDINTLMTSIIHSNNSFQHQIGTTQAHKASSNAAIISLLNSAPAAMTSSAVVNNLNTPSSSPVTIPIQRLIPANSHVDSIIQQQQQQSSSLLNQSPSHQSVDNQHSNVRVTMSALASQLASPPAMMSSSPINPSNYNFAQLKPQQSTNQPPQQILMNNNNSSNSNSSNSNSGTTSNRLIGQQTVIRRDSLAAPSPGSDSNASNASSTNLGSSFPGFPFIGSATSPTTSIISNDGQLSNQSSCGGLNDRITNSSNPLSHSPISAGGPSPLSSASSSHFIGNPSPKNSLQTISPLSSPSHQQTESSGSVNTGGFQIAGRKHSMNVQDGGENRRPSNENRQSAGSNPSQPQTATLNLHGINFSSLQGAMATFPGLQNVQVQIPGLNHSISLSLRAVQSVQGENVPIIQQQPHVQSVANSSATLATTNQHPTGLLVSVPVSNASNQLQVVSSGLPGSLNQPTQTVVLTTAGQQGQAGSMLSLPIAQLVAASSVKNLNQQQLRNASIAGVNLGTMQAHQQQQNPAQAPQIQHQRPRSVPTIATSPINAKQLTARGLITTSQRNITVSAPNTNPQSKTPITMTSAPVNNNQNAARLLQHLQQQQQQFHHQYQHQQQKQ